MNFDPSNPDLARELAGQMLRLRKLGRFPENHDQYKHRQMHFLFLLSKLMQPGQQGVKASDLSKNMHITRGGISQMINEMEAAGLIERISDPTDRRVVLITTTENGKRQMDEAFAFMQKNLAEIISFLGEEDSRQLIRILNRIIPYLADRKTSPTPNPISSHGANH